MKETSRKAVGLCVLAFVLGLFMSTMFGCATTNETKMHVREKTFSAAAGVGVRMEDK